MNKVEYQGASIEVDDAVYKHWLETQKSISKIVGTSEGEKDNAREWATYNVLFDAGHFVSKPVEAPQSLAQIAFMPTEATSSSQPSYPEYPNYPTYEEGWTREKILNEKARLLKEKEAFLRKQEMVFARQKKAFQANVQQGGFTHPNGKPYSEGDYISSLVTMFIIIVVLGLLFSFCR